MTKSKIGQYFNLDGIYFLFKNILILNKIKPNIRVKSVNDINLDDLKNISKIKYVIFDKDNTLTFPHDNKPANIDITKKINEFVQTFGKENLAILSNSAGSRDDKNFVEANEIEKNFGIQVIKHENKKPRVYKEILDTFNIQNNNKVDNYNICMIGDRLLVDVIMGKEFNFFTILVDPLSNEKDNFVVKLARKIENWLI